MNREGLRRIVAIMVIAAMVLLAIGAVGSLLGGSSADATPVGAAPQHAGTPVGAGIGDTVDPDGGA